MRQLKVGIIGAGMAFERLHYPAYQQLTDRYEIVALCDVDKGKAINWANRLNLRKLWTLMVTYFIAHHTHRLRPKKPIFCSSII